MRTPDGRTGAAIAVAAVLVGSAIISADAQAVGHLRAMPGARDGFTSILLPRETQTIAAQLSKGEHVRESHVVEAAEAATLERALTEAKLATSGEWQSWFDGGRYGAALSPGGYSLPARGTLTSGFGPRAGGFHRGIDIANAIGTPIYAAAAGTVVDAGPAQGFGLWVRIRHSDGSISVYGHLYDFFVSKGEQVPAGLQIARMGNRGDSSGPHLHFEVIQGGDHVDPQRWLANRGVAVG